MKRWLYTYRLVNGRPESLERTLLAHVSELLRLAAAAPEDEVAPDGSILLEVEAHVAGIDLGKQVRVRTGVAYHSGGRMVLPISWHAEPAKLAFPAFQGTLELDPMSASVAQLTLAGGYGVPLGPLGAAADATVLREVAVNTADRLVSGIARELRRLDAAGGVEIQPAGPRRGQPLQVRDVMTSDPIVIDEDLPLRTAALILFHNEISGAPVVGGRGELVGVLSERDLLAKEATQRFGIGKQAAAEERRREAHTAGEACSKPARVTVPEARLSAVARELLDHDVSRLVVVDDGKVAGIVSRHDVLAALIRDDRELQAAVEGQLVEYGTPEIRASVQWGEVTLSGVTALRSRAARLAGLVEDVDGVMSVDDSAVAWVEDDIVTVAPMPFT